MSLEIIKAPQSIDFYNGLNFQIHCPSHIVSAGTPTSFYYQIIIPNAGLSGRFLIPAPEAYIPVDFGIMSPPSAYVLPLTSDLDVIAGLLNTFHDVSRYYTVTVNVDKLIFTAKYNFESVIHPMSFYDGIAFTMDNSFVNGSNEVSDSKYIVKVNLRFNDTDVSFTLTPDSEHNIDFDISKYFGKKLSGDISVADNSAVTKDLLISYQIEFKEFSGDAAFSSSNFSAKSFPGKMPVYLYDSWVPSFTGFITTSNYIEIFKDSKHFIHYVYSGYDLPGFSMKIFYTDGTTETLPIALSIADGTYLFFIPCGPRQNGNESLFNPDKIWYKYDIFQNDPDVAISFVLKDRPIDARQFIFSNIQGLYESITFTGIQSEITKRDAVITESSALYSKNKLQSTIRNIYREYEISTGPKLRNEIDAVKQFFQSENTFFYDTDLNEFVRIELLSEEMPGISDDAEIFDFSFKYRRSYND